METVRVVTMSVTFSDLVWAAIVISGIAVVLVALVYRLLKRVNIAQKHNFATINRYQESAQQKLDHLARRLDDLSHDLNRLRRDDDETQRKLDVIVREIEENR